MDHFAGLDVSVKESSICIVDDTGKIAREVKVASGPDALLAVLMNPAYCFKRIGLEAGPLSQWLFSDIDTVVVDGLKVLDPKGPIREADIPKNPHLAKDSGARLWHREPATSSWGSSS